MKFFIRISIVFCLGMIVSCSILKKEDPEKEIRNFLTNFQSDLTKSDDDILAKFRVKQSREAVLSVINILQNKDPFIVCEPSFTNAQITFEDEIIKVDIPTSFRVKELGSKDSAFFTLRMWLTPTENSYQITQLDGEEFYQEFSKIKNNNQWDAERKLAEHERTWVYETAKKLEEKFDSVIWYAIYSQENYFYVVEGNWNNYFLSYDTRSLKNTNVKMGLVNAQGETIVPLEYDLIGTIGFEKGDLVEVTKNGKVGYFNIKTKQLIVEPWFDFIIPYGRENAWAVVKQDSVYGWLDEEFKFSNGFASKKMEDWLNNFEFLKQTITLKSGTQVFCEIPNPEYTGNGIIIPPAYLSKNGIFDEIESGISTTKVPMNGWTEYKEASGSFLETVTDNIRAVVTTIKERYLEGREEFYTSNSLVFVDKKLEKLGQAIISGSEVSMHPIDSTLLEVRTPYDFWFMENDACEERNLYEHSYFTISPSKEIVQLKSNRLFAQTQFIKLDSSYLMGYFTVYIGSTEKEEQRTFLSVKTITFMRDEILASYGLAFTDKEKNDHFNHLRKENQTIYSTIQEFESQITDIDKYNLAFLNKILGLLGQPSPA